MPAGVFKLRLGLARMAALKFRLGSCNPICLPAFREVLFNSQKPDIREKAPGQQPSRNFNPRWNLSK